MRKTDYRRRIKKINKKVRIFETNEKLEDWYHENEKDIGSVKIPCKFSDIFRQFLYDTINSIR